MVGDEIFHDLFELAADAMFILDQDRVIKEINQVAYEQLGYTKDEMLGRNVSDFFPPQDAALTKSRFSKIQNHGYLIYESAMIRKDGSVFPVEIGNRAIDLGEQKAYFAVVRDISERRQSEAKLHQLEETLHAIFDGTLDGICLVNAKTLQFETGNPAFCSMIGYSPEELTQLGLRDFHREQDLPYVIEQFEKSSCGEIQIATDIPVKCKDGSVLYVDIKPNGTSSAR